MSSSQPDTPTAQVGGVCLATHNASYAECVFPHHLCLMLCSSSIRRTSQQLQCHFRVKSSWVVPFIHQLGSRHWSTHPSVHPSTSQMCRESLTENIC